MSAQSAKDWRKRNPGRMRALRTKWRETNRLRATKQSRAGSAKVKAGIRAFMDAAKSVPCMDCGGTFDPICMDFDHRPGEVKVNNVGLLRTLEDVKAEIAKCDVVCSNCHRLRTKTRGQWGPKRKTAPATASPQLSLLEDTDNG